METYSVVVRGMLPLLHGRMDPRGEPSGGKDEKQRFYDSQWLHTSYFDAEGNLYQPFYTVKSCIVKGMKATAKSGDSEKGKGVSQQMARACLRVQPIRIPLGVTVPEERDARVLSPMAAWTLEPNGQPTAFVVRRLCSRGVEVSNLAVSDWTLQFNLLDTSEGFFDAEWLRAGVDYAVRYVGLGTWRPDFGIGELVSLELVN